MKISGKTAIVTGGASGLGLATVKRLVDAGANVSVFDLNALADESLAGSAQVLCRQVDVADASSVTAAVSDTLARFGAIHICCNFAGIAVAAKTIGRDGPHALDLYDKVIRVNLVGAFNVLRLAAAQMVANEPFDAHGGRGVIINTASVAAFEGQIGQAAYSASKGGIAAMTVPIARDLAALGIRVNTIAPGVIHTPIFKCLDEQVIESLEQSVLFPKRLGAPDEVARLAVFIIENDYINAETIRIDGGIRMPPR
ncbi:MAG: SDR family NAD(P)-dependent oxidoreductase [Gammaproteobacteria bacterium]|nr:SDR family NAD(P)-dependent oxidoreductase [Gammaproteobacteria bacterium]MCY4282757.1 SDR family NAD(P)-dependent oxidoreductase [Gammaproteobacteria bacterium]